AENHISFSATAQSRQRRSDPVESLPIRQTARGCLRESGKADSGWVLPPGVSNKLLAGLCESRPTDLQYAASDRQIRRRSKPIRKRSQDLRAWNGRPDTYYIRLKRPARNRKVQQRICRTRHSPKGRRGEMLGRINCLLWLLRPPLLIV